MTRARFKPGTACTKRPSPLVWFYRDEQGSAMLEYAMVFGFVAVPIIFLFDKLFDVLSDYFGMIAFFVSWPLI